MKSTKPSRRNYFLGLVLLFGLTAILLTWPTAAQFTRSVPIGTEATATVPLFNLWTLGWGAESTLHGYRDFWNAPIFWPNQGAFAFSEPQPLPGAITNLLSFLALAAQYNTILLLYLMLNGLVAFLFFKYLGVPTLVSLFGGFYCQALPFLTHERGVLQLQPVFVIILTLFAALRLLERANWRQSLLLGIALGGSFYISEYLGMLGMTFVFITFAVAMKKNRLSLPVWMLALVIGFAIAAPLAVGQSRILASYEFERSNASITAGSANIQDYFTPSQSTYLSTWAKTGNVSFGLFPGVTMTLLGLFALFFQRGSRLKDVKIILGLGLLLSFLLSLGLNLSLFGVKPYSWLVKNIMGIAHLRSPFRFGLLAQFALLALAVLGLKNLLRIGKWRFIFASVMLVVEILPLPTDLDPLPEIPHLTGIQSPAVYLPFVRGGSSTAYFQTVEWMLIAQESQIEIVNGYSGYFPESNTESKAKLLSFPDVSSIEYLSNLGVKTIIVPTLWMKSHAPSEISEMNRSNHLIYLGDQQGFSLYKLP